MRSVFSHANLLTKGDRICKHLFEKSLKMESLEGKNSSLLRAMNRAVAGFTSIYFHLLPFFSQKTGSWVVARAENLQQTSGHMHGMNTPRPAPIGTVWISVHLQLVVCPLRAIFIVQAHKWPQGQAEPRVLVQLHGVSVAERFWLLSTSQNK